MRKGQEMKIEIEAEILERNRKQITEDLKAIQKEIEIFQEETNQLNICWEGPASAAYQARTAEDVNYMFQVCQELAKYTECMEYAVEQYVKCQQKIQGIIKKIRI